MNRYVLVYMSMIDHLRKGLLAPNELVVLVSLVLAAGWSEGRADYARVERNVHKLHRELFYDQETGNQVWTRQGLDKIVKALVAKGYVADEGKWWYLPSYRKWQMEVPQALKTQKNLAKSHQEKATGVAKSLVEDTQEKATPVAIEGSEKQPQLLPGATPVAKKATGVAKKATPVAPDGLESGATSESPAPSYMIHATNIHTPPPPAHASAHEGISLEELFVARIVHTLDEYVFTLAPIQVTGIVDELDDPPPLLRDSPAEWCEWICLAIKEAADNGVRNARYVARVIQTSREKQAPPGSTQPTKGGHHRGHDAKPSNPESSPGQPDGLSLTERLRRRDQGMPGLRPDDQCGPQAFGSGLDVAPEL